MKTIGIRRTLIIASLVSLFVSYLGIWIRLINDPVERTGADFIAFYSAGRISEDVGAASVYNLVLQQQIQEGEVGFPLIQGQVLLYNHLPFLIPILQMIVSTSYVSSFYRWIFLLTVLYIASITILSQLLKQANIDRNSILLTAIGSFLFLPVFFSLMNGQDTALLFLGTAIWMYGLISNKEYLAGVGLSLTTVRPQIALFLALPMIFRHARVFWGFLLSSGFLAWLSVLILGMDGTKEFINILLISAGGEWYGMKENAMYNLIGLLVRGIPQLELGTIRTLGWSVYGIALVGLCVLWSKTQGLKDELIGLTTTLALFVAPHLHFHDLALLLIPIYGLVRTSEKTGLIPTSIAVLVPIAVSLTFLISNISLWLQYSVPYFIMFAFAIYPFYISSNKKFA